MDSGFLHVDPSEAKPHLYHIKGIRTTLSLVQLLVQRDRLNSGDVFILVCGEDKVWLWIGSDANSDNRVKGSEVAREVPPEIGGFDLPIVRSLIQNCNTPPLQKSMATSEPFARSSALASDPIQSQTLSSPQTRMKTLPEFSLSL